MSRTSSFTQDSAKDVKDIKAQVEGLTTIVRQLTDKVEAGPKNTRTSYADVLRQGAAPKIPTSTRLAPVPARHSRELMVSLGEETPPQRLRTGASLVSEINTALKQNHVVAARRLPSGDITIAFLEADRREELRTFCGGKVDVERLLDTPKEAIISVRWMVQSGQLPQFRLAKALSYEIGEYQQAVRDIQLFVRYVQE